ncbi:MAG: hypothetical protein IKA85_04540 [Clostridia bacterium]|nr:hypothetical protein [Clostridia bacterium]
MKDEKLLNEIENEVLFKPSGENLSYQEPKKPSDNEGVIIESVNGLVEEKITITTEEESDKLQAEVLFKSGIEEIEVREELSLEEEKLTFNEPVKPEFMEEEVLFANTEEEVVNYSIFDNEILPETTETELLSTQEETAITGDYQLNFDDINVITTDEAVIKPKVIKKNFAEKLIEADEVIKENYCELKNMLLSYKKMKSRISNTADTFNIGRTKLAKLSVSGKSLKLYLNLDIDEVESRLKCKDASETKAYEEVPVFLRIRSLRAMKNARYLIGKLAERFDLQLNPKFEKIDAMELIREELE